MDDYTKAMTSKYRRRYKSARKKGEQIQTRLLDEQELQQRHHEFQPLLEAVIAKSGFCLAPETTQLYVEMKKQLATDFVFRTYEFEGKTIGFSTAIHNNSTLIAHRVGIDYAFNQTHKLYQNMLYDYVETGLHKNCHTVNYGRTAPEIKSAVGAEPKPLYFMIRHPSWIPNQALKWIVPTTNQTKWIQRHPFKHRQTKQNKPVVKPKAKANCCILKWFSCSPT